MSNKISGFTVVFKEGFSEQYMDKIKDAVMLFDGVVSVEPIVEDTQTYIGKSQEGYRIKQAIIDLVKNDFK